MRIFRFPGTFTRGDHRGSLILAISNPIAESVTIAEVMGMILIFIF